MSVCRRDWVRVIVAVKETFLTSIWLVFSQYMEFLLKLLHYELGFNTLFSFIFHTQNTVLTFSLLNYNNILRIEKTRPGTADILVTDRYVCVCHKVWLKLITLSAVLISVTTYIWNFTVELGMYMCPCVCDFGCQISTFVVINDLSPHWCWAGKSKLCNY